MRFKSLNKYVKNAIKNLLIIFVKFAIYLMIIKTKKFTIVKIAKFAEQEIKKIVNIALNVICVILNTIKIIYVIQILKNKVV